MRFAIFLISLLAASATAAAAEKSDNQIYHEMAAFTKTLNAEETRHFYLLYNNYNMIQNVGMVRQDISRAVDSCSDKNPDMEDRMRKRFKDWTDEIDPPLKEARLKLDTMAASQKYAPPEKIQEVFQLVDDTRKEAESDMTKVPVSSPEACEYLLEKLDNTEERLVGMLQSTLVDYADTVPLAGEKQRQPLIDVQPPRNSKNQ